MLSLVYAARESDIETLSEVNREMLKLVFAFDHVNYGYNRYQHVFLLENSVVTTQWSTMICSSHSTYTSLLVSADHGDLMVEYMNGKIKGQADLFQISSH